MINNLSQLKKALVQGARFEMVEHFIKPEHTGEIRVVNKVQTNAIYSKVYNEPDNPVSTANGGLGYFMQYGKASDWTFENGLCTCVNIRGVKCFTLKVLGEDEKTDKEDLSA